MDGCGRLRIALGQELVRALRPSLVVEALPALSLARLGRRRQVELGERGPEVEARPADDDRCSPGRQDLVDRRVRELLVLADRGLVVERPDPDEPPQATGS